MTLSPSTMPWPLRKLQSLIAGWRFPVFMLALLATFQVWLLAALTLPAADDGVGAFAESFRVWCYGYDPATGTFEWAYVATLILDPVMLAGVVLGVWWRPLRAQVRERPRALIGPAAAAVVVATGLAFGLLGLDRGPAVDPADLPFPAEALRTAQTPPAFALTNQEGQPVSLDRLEGQVVVVTAVYASCGFTCPMIMGQAKRVVEGLTPAEREGLTVVGITLDPEHDTVERLAAMAAGQQVAAPRWNLCTGEPGEVNGLLDAFGVARRRDPVTGVIDHANLFILIDRDGRVAYRLSLGEQQERWLGSAVRVLLAERRSARTK